MRTRQLAVACAASLMVLSTHVAAQTAPAGHPNLPVPDPAFRGRIGTSFEDSKPDFPQPIRAPKGAPNIVVILLDDLGFGQPGTFGGPVPTPALDKLASNGLRYNRFHTTAICSPTRAALLTGRNHHQVATGTITELATGFPGYNSIWPRSTTTVARVLTENGYSTAAFGKWHNTPDWETSAAGPFNHWPTGLGFQYWYGFQGGETSQWEPQLFRNTTPVEPRKRAEQGYHLTEDLVDEAIGWINRQKSLAPDKPFYIHFATGATHAPLHAPEEWIAKFKGQFDQGWDEVRRETLERQKKLGVVPPDTQLTPRPKEIEAWSTLSPDAKRVFARHQEAFAGFLAHTDYHVGRLLETVAKLPDAGNTLIFYIAGDNGPSAEGSPAGTLNNMATQNGLPDTVEAQLAKIDEIGGHLHENHYPVGWAWAGTAPFQWMKRVPSHFGGTRNGMVVSWPVRIKATGEVRSQFHHVIDIVPTIYKLSGVAPPLTVDGIKQTPISGVDISYSFADAKAADTRTTQYFETGGHRAIYHNGWVAASFHGVPWQTTGSIGFKNNGWQLYDIRSDFSQSRDLATANPAKLKELQAIFDREAKKFNVYPLDDRFAERASAAGRPSLIEGRTTFAYAEGMTRVPEGSAPPIYQRSHRIKAKVTVPDTGAEGVIVAEGGGSGYALYVQDGRVHYSYNFFGRAIYDVVSGEPLPTGEVEILLDYKQQPFRPFVETKGGVAELFVNGRSVAKGNVDNVAPVRFSATESFDVGMDLGAPAIPAYREKLPFTFTGKIISVEFDLDKQQPVLTEAKK